MLAHAVPLTRGRLAKGTWLDREAIGRLHESDVRSVEIAVPGTDETEFVWVEAVARNGAIDIQLSSSTTGERTVRSWDVRQANGAPLPAGVDQMGDYLVVNRPLAADTLHLRVRALLENGQSVSQSVVIDLRTATVTPDGEAVVANQTLHEQMAELVRQADAADRPLLDAAE